MQLEHADIFLIEIYCIKGNDYCFTDSIQKLMLPYIWMFTSLFDSDLVWW